MVGDEGIIASSHCWCWCQDEGRNGGPSLLCCCQGRVMAYHPHCVVVVLLQGGRVRAH